MVSLKRNEYEWQTNSRRKILTEVKYPCVLRVAVERPAETINTATEYQFYVLYSVVFHSGYSSDSGHYYCISRDSELAIETVQSAFPHPHTAKLAPNEDNARDKVPDHQSLACQYKSKSGYDGSVLQQSAHEEHPRHVLNINLEQLEALSTSQANKDSWCIFNDGVVSSSSFEMLSNITKTFPQDVAYLLFYRKFERLSVKTTSQTKEKESTKRIKEEITVDNMQFMSA